MFGLGNDWSVLSIALTNNCSITSLREYFAAGFEEFYLGDRAYLKKNCPYIYNKLQLLESSGEDLL